MPPPIGASLFGGGGGGGLPAADSEILRACVAARGGRRRRRGARGGLCFASSRRSQQIPPTHFSRNEKNNGWVKFECNVRVTSEFECHLLPSEENSDGDSTAYSEADSASIGRDGDLDYLGVVAGATGGGTGAAGIVAGHKYVSVRGSGSGYGNGRSGGPYMEGGDHPVAGVGSLYTSGASSSVFP